MAITNRTRNLVGISALAVTVLMAAPAAAQSHDTDEGVAAQSAVDEDPAPQAIVVTGSRISGIDPVGSTVLSVGREDIDTSSATDTAQLLREIPQVSNIGTSESSRGQAGGAENLTFVNSVNIRGIAPYATLTLLNGHRTVGQGTTGFAVDPTIIPPVALERVEIVADGASAIYGSDAVTGVANLILRRNYDGIGIGGKVGLADDYREYQANAIVGKDWSWGRFMAAYSYSEHSALSGRDRDFYSSDLTSRGGGDYRTNQCDPGNIVVGGTSYAIPDGGVTEANRDSLTPGTTNLCDNTKNQDLIPFVSRHSAVATLDIDVTDWMQIYGDGFYVWRDYDVELPNESAVLNVPNTNAFFVSPPGTDPASEQVRYAFGNDYTYTRFGHSETVNGTLGARFLLPGGFKLEADYTRGWNLDYSERSTVVDNAALQAALASSDPDTAFNPFGGGNSQAVIDSILIGVNINQGRTNFTGYSANLDGPLFALPGGEVRAVVGYERQENDIQQNPIRGTISSPRPIVEDGQGRSVDSFYGELFVPLFGPDNAMPGVQSLELDLALRHDLYSDVGATTNPKIGVNYEPIEGLTLRGSYGTSFRAPSLFQIYGNTNTLYIRQYADPTCDCITDGVVRSGGNLNLEPESATSWSFGLDIEPVSMPDFRASFSFFDLVYEGQVQRYLTDFTILGQEELFEGSGVITRNPSAELIAQQVAETGYTGLLPDSPVLFVDGRSLNLGVTKARGIDFLLGYQMPTDNAGTFGLQLDGTYFLKYETAITPNAPLVDRRNQLYNPLTFKARGRLNWTNDDGLRAEATVNFVNGYENPTVTPVQDIDAQATFDLYVGMELRDAFSLDVPEAVRLGLSVRNLFDADPPFVDIASGESSPGGFDATVANPVGRLVALSLSTEF